jgi:hypothetical protein
MPSIKSPFVLISLGFFSCLMTACGPEADEPFVEEPVPRCAQSCGGCCIGETCQTGDQASACGSGGVTCMACAGTDICDASSTPRTCTLDLSATWRVQPSSATIAQQTTNGFDWDADGSPPDVVVEGTCPSAGEPIPFHTPEVESLTPQWTEGGCLTTADALLKNDVQLKVIDVDVLADDTIAAGTYRFTKNDLGRGTITLQLPSQLGTLTFQLTRQ